MSEIKVSAGLCFLQRLQGRVLPFLFQLRVASRVSCLVEPELQSPPPSSHSCLLCVLSSSYKEPVDFRPTLIRNENDLILIGLIVSVKTLFPNKVTF